MVVELKPCPFCGGGADCVKHSAGVPRTMAFDSWHAVACRACGATVGACDRRFRNKADAAAAWNLRPLNQPAGVFDRSGERINELAKAAGFNLEPTANMLYTVRGNHAQLVNFARLVLDTAGVDVPGEGKR